MDRKSAAIIFVSLIALSGIVPSSRAAVTWSELQLVDASGVPNDLSHGYWFKGMLVLWHQKSSSSTSLGVSVPPVKIVSKSENVIDASIWVEGKGKWNEKTNEAEEKLVFEGDAAGRFISRFKCTKDPWIYPASCTVVTAQYESTKGKIWDFPGMVKKWKRPLTQPGVTLAAAESLSAKHKSTAAVPPPPPPGPQAGKKLSSPKKGTTAGGAGSPPSSVTASTAKEIATSPGGVASAPAQPAVPGTPNALPDLSSEPSVMIGTKPGQWGGIVAVNASEARRVHDGACDFAVRHTAKNAGTSVAATTGRQWTNSNVAGVWDMTYPPIPPGGKVERVDTLPLKPGRNVLYLTLDSGKAVAESNENNNLYRIAVDLAGTCAPGQPSGAPPMRDAGGRLKGR